MSSVERIGTRVIEPTSSSPPPDEASLIRRAQSLLNQIAGTDRLPTDGRLAGETRACLERFQESAGLPPTGCLDRETLVELERAATRALCARDTELLATPSCVAEPPGELEVAAALREAFGIPELGATGRPARDGWRIDSDAGTVRYMGLVRYRPSTDDVPGRFELAMAPVLARLETPEGRHRVDEAIERVVDAGGPSVDRSLLLALATREAGADRIFASHTRRHDSYDGGGIDNLWRLLPELHLPEAVRARIEPARGVPRDTSEPSGRHNETRHDIYPADVEGRDTMTVYAAMVARCEERLLATATAVFESEDAGREFIGSMSEGERRAFVQLAFGRPFGAAYEGDERTYDGGFGLRTALGRCRELGTASAILTDPWMGEFQTIRRARVTAAEAELIDRLGGE